MIYQQLRNKKKNRNQEILFQEVPINRQDFFKTNRIISQI